MNVQVIRNGRQDISERYLTSTH